jgi:hypothetical protein
LEDSSDDDKGISPVKFDDDSPQKAPSPPMSPVHQPQSPVKKLLQSKPVSKSNIEVKPLERTTTTTTTSTTRSPVRDTTRTAKVIIDDDDDENDNNDVTVQPPPKEDLVTRLAKAEAENEKGKVVVGKFWNRDHTAKDTKTLSSEVTFIQSRLKNI